MGRRRASSTLLVTVGLLALPALTPTWPVATALAVCGDLIRDRGEDCDPPGGIFQCQRFQVCNAQCQCEFKASCDGRCGTPDPPRRLEFVAMAPTSSCGTLKDATGTILPTACSGGGSQASCRNIFDCKVGEFCSDAHLVC